MQIAVACKVVPDDQDILVNADGSLDYSKAHLTVSTYDLNAIEAAARLAESVDARLVAVSVGPNGIDDSKVKKSILSRGIEELYMLADDLYENSCARSTAKALQALVERAGEVDVIVCGDGSADNYAQQVDVQLAEAMRLPCVNGVVAMRLEGSLLIVDRMLEDSLETVEVSLPAVVSVSPDAALPRICGMKEILAAGKKPSNVYAAADVDVSGAEMVEIEDVRTPQEQARRHEIYDSAVDGDVEKFISALKETLH